MSQTQLLVHNQHVFCNSLLFRFLTVSKCSSIFKFLFIFINCFGFSTSCVILWSWGYYPPHVVRASARWLPPRLLLTHRLQQRSGPWCFIVTKCHLAISLPTSMHGKHGPFIGRLLNSATICARRCA